MLDHSAFNLIRITLGTIAHVFFRIELYYTGIVILCEANGMLMFLSNLKSYLLYCQIIITKSVKLWCLCVYLACLYVLTNNN